MTASGAGAADALRHCESVATSAVVRGVAARTLGADPTFAAGLRKALAPLVRARATGRRALAHGGSPRAAERVANAYATAAASLAVPRAGADERAAQRRLLAALTRAQSAYLRLGAALQARQHAPAVAAAASIAAVERAADAALRSLAALGYAPA